MTTPRSQIPATNLKERIAALEQRNAESTAPVQRATSPTPSVTSSSSHSGSSNGALRDRIARFEKKGGVPMPKGRFGFGAPPSLEGTLKRGELYGNRIPAPVRTVSGGTLPLSRPVSTATYDQRRSFSASSITSDFDDDHLDYGLISSPTFTSPSDSPDSSTPVSITGDISPSFSDFSRFKQHLARGIPFADALEVARRAETEKEELQTSTTLTSRLPPLSEDGGRVETPADTTPTIVISSEDVPPVIMPESSTENATSAPSMLASDTSEKVLPDEEFSYKPPSETVIANGTSSVITTNTYNPLVTKGVARVGTPPLIIRKRTPADLSTPSVTDKALKDPDTNDVLIESQVLVSTIAPNSHAIKLHDISPSGSHTGTLDSVPTAVQPKVGGQLPSENTELQLSAPEIFPTPVIVVSDGQAEENIQEPTDAINDVPINSKAEPLSHEFGLTLDLGKLNDGLLTSPPPQSSHAPHRATTAPPGAFQSFSTTPAAKAFISPDFFLSPPGTGLHFDSPLSGDSSLSSPGSRSMSMIETSPKLVTQLLRMTPATSRAVPMFFPASQGRPRKSDFVYFPPTPEDEDTNLGSLTMQKSSQSNRMRSGSDPEDMHGMRLKPTFSAVVHRKVRETPVPATVPENNLRPPQTLQSQQVKRATILETPLSPGLGELAALLQEAVLLEDTLNKGELPSENPQFEEKEQRAKEATAAATRQKAEDEERSQLALAAAHSKSKRDEPTTGRLKHTFLVPLSEARSQPHKGAYTAKAKTKPVPVPPIHLNPAALSSKATAHSFAMGSVTSSKLPTKQPAVDGVSSSNSTIQLPTMSPKSPRFSSLRKFSSISRVVGDGASARTSHSTSSEISSEESSSGVTAENSLEFGHGTGSTLSFPSASPKKVSSSLMRAASFAEKLWSRTKSGGSTLSSTDEIKDRFVHDLPEKTPVRRTPTIGLPPSFDLPTPSCHPAFSLQQGDEQGQIVPLRRSSSSKRSAIYFSHAPDLTTVPQSPPIEITPQTSPSSLFPVISNESTRPSSANSFCSVGSLPSPLFGQELVDAFPSVPVTTPNTTIISHKFPHRELATPATASFDTALLSSAIHLASTGKLTTPKARFKPLPSERVVTPTPTSRPSGDVMR